MRAPSLRFALFAVSLVIAGSAKATPVESSCLFMEVMGSNDTAAVPAMIGELASSWPEANRSGATETLIKVLNERVFSGGSVWRIAQLGNDVEEHLVILRLADGEVSGARLLYQWSPNGLVLTTMDFKRRYAEIVATQLLQAPEPIACGDGG